MGTTVLQKHKARGEGAPDHPIQKVDATRGYCDNLGEPSFQGIYGTRPARRLSLL
jgi:hypothetical protein